MKRSATGCRCSHQHPGLNLSYITLPRARKTRFTPSPSAPTNRGGTPTPQRPLHCPASVAPSPKANRSTASSVLEPTTTAWMTRATNPGSAKSATPSPNSSWPSKTPGRIRLACENVIARLGRLTNQAPETGNSSSQPELQDCLPRLREKPGQPDRGPAPADRSQAPYSSSKNPPPARTDGAYTGDKNRLPPAYANDYAPQPFELNTDFSQAWLPCPSPMGFHHARRRRQRHSLPPRRHLDDGQILFSSTTSIESPSSALSART